MKMDNLTVGLSNDQITSGTPSQKRIVLKAFFKDDKCTISPAKDMNGRYVGIKENIPEIKKLEMGYVPTPESRVKIYDGMEIDLNDDSWAKDWEWMKHCTEIANNFEEGQGTPGAYFYIYRPGYESSKKVERERETLKLKSYILEDSPENLYNRVKVLGTDMDDATISDVQEFLLTMVARRVEEGSAIPGALLRGPPRRAPQDEGEGGFTPAKIVAGTVAVGVAMATAPYSFSNLPE